MSKDLFRPEQGPSPQENLEMLRDLFQHLPPPLPSDMAAGKGGLKDEDLTPEEIEFLQGLRPNRIQEMILRKVVIPSRRQADLFDRRQTSEYTSKLFMRFDDLIDASELTVPAQTFARRGFKVDVLEGVARERYTTGYAGWLFYPEGNIFDASSVGRVEGVGLNRLGQYVSGEDAKFGDMRNRLLHNVWKGIYAETYGPIK